MKKYKIFNPKTWVVIYTKDKVFADFMNKRLTLWQRILKFFFR